MSDNLIKINRVGGKPEEESYLPKLNKKLGQEFVEEKMVIREIKEERKEYQERPKSNYKNFVRKTAIFCVVIVVSATGWWAVSQYKDRNIEQSQMSAEDAALSVSRLMSVPDEAPNVATIDDVSKVKDQPFYAKAAEGDKVLIYTNAGLIVLYRPTTDKIIEFAYLK